MKIIFIMNLRGENSIQVLGWLLTFMMLIRKVHSYSHIGYFYDNSKRPFTISLIGIIASCRKILLLTVLLILSHAKSLCVLSSLDEESHSWLEKQRQSTSSLLDYYILGGYENKVYDDKISKRSFRQWKKFKSYINTPETRNSYPSI